MHVVVVGAGKLGYSIAELLSQEQMDVALIDKEESQLEAARATLDVLTICANGTSPTTMNEPDVRGADLLIAVTAIDEVNMVSCILAKKSGVKKTVARIRDTQFMTEAREYLKENFSIDLMLNPELVTASEINRILMTSAALNVEDFAGGKVRLFETRIHRDSKILGVPLKELELPEGVLAAMISRDHRMIIPHGEDKFLRHDNAYFVGMPEQIEKFSKHLIQQSGTKLRRVMIIGAGRTGRVLAKILDAQKVNVKVIEKDQDRCRRTAELMKDGLAICGDGTDMDLLMEEGVENADVVICLTEDDKLNLMLALLAKHLKAKRTIVRVSRVEYMELMEKVGVDVVVSARLLSASEVLAFARSGGVVSVSLLEGAKAEAVEMIVQKDAPIANKRLMDVKLPKECLICAYVRDGKAYIPRGDTVLLPGDRTIAVIQIKFTQKVMKYFKGKNQNMLEAGDR